MLLLLASLSWQNKKKNTKLFHLILDHFLRIAFTVGTLIKLGYWKLEVAQMEKWLHISFMMMILFMRECSTVPTLQKKRRTTTPYSNINTHTHTQHIKFKMIWLIFCTRIFFIFASVFIQFLIAWLDSMFFFLFRFFSMAMRTDFLNRIEMIGWIRVYFSIMHTIKTDKKKHCFQRVFLRI